MATSLFVIDSRVANCNAVIASLAADTGYVVLDREHDGVVQIMEALAGKSGYSSIQIISHGTPGSIMLGSSVLDSVALYGYSAMLATIGSALLPTGDLLLYGCNVGAGDVGQHFVTTLAQLTGADVAVSDDLTGNAVFGGDWVLEVQSGSIETVVQPLAGLEGVLVNSAPTLTAFAAPVDSVAEDTAVEITLDEVKAQGDEADSDGSVDAFVVKAVNSGILKIGITAASATVWNMASNATIDATHSGWWTSAANANGTLNAFSVVAKDNGGAESATAVQATVTVSSLNDAPSFLVGDGKATSMIGFSNDVAESVAIQNDGKILVGGWSFTGSYSDMALVRYNANGTIDLPFGAGGRINGMVGSESYLKTILVQSDGKILVAGNNPGDILLDRFNADGSLDNSFDSDGMVVTSIGSGVDACNQAVVQGDGKIIVAGYTTNGSYKDAVLVRYTSSGVLDPTFNTSGKLVAATGIKDDEFTSVALQTDGKILAAGYSNNGASQDIVVARYTTAGVLDSSFGNAGLVTTPIGSYNDVGQTMAVQSDGKILVGGWSFNGDYNDGIIVRYNSDGLLDTSFGNAGIILADIASGDDMIRAITTQRDGKILVTLWSDNFGSPNFVLARYNSNGMLDTSFDGDGIVTTDIGVGDDVSNSVTVQSDGKIVVVGKSNNGSNDDVAVVRYNSDGSLDTTFDPINTLSSKPTYTEGGTAALLGSDIKIFDADLAPLGNYGGATLTLARHGGANADDRFSGDGIVAGSASGTVTVAGSNIGTYTWSTGTLTISFTTQATQTLVNQAVDALAYQNINTAPPATVQFDWTFSDGNSSGAQGSGGVLSTTGYKTVAITAVTQAPTLTAFSGAAATTNEDTLGTITFADLIAKGNEADADGSVTAFVVKALSNGNLKIGANATTATLYDEVVNNIIDATHNAYWLPVGDTNGILNAFTVVARDNEQAISATTVQVTVNTVAVNDAPTFYVGNGLVTTDVTSGNDYGYSVAVQNDGKILMAGTANNDFAIVRYNTDGTLDTTFDSDGKVATDFNLSSDDARGMVVQSDGKIVVVGTNGSDVALMRYRSSGTLDTAFDGDGKVNTSVNSGVEAGKSVALQSNGKIVVAGYTTNSSGYTDALLLRYNKDGSLDATFDGDGIATTALSIQNDEFRSVVLQADGKILAAGYSRHGSYNDVALVRYNSDGSLDTGFGAGGIVTTAIGADDVGQGVTVQADGKILVAGYSDNNFALLRYNAEGTLDTSFGTDGKVITDISYNDHGNSVIVQTDGKILVAGNSWYYIGAYGAYDYGFTLVRYNSNGSLDTTFDNDGKIYDDLWVNASDAATCVTLQNDGKILVGGYAENDHFFALIRYNTNGSRDTTFNQTTNTLNGALAYTENGTAAVLDSDVQIVDSEATVKGNYGDATLTLERHGGSNAEDCFSGSGIIAGSASGNVVVASTNIGSYTWANGKLLVTFNVQATPTLVNQAMRALAYSNASDTPSSSAQIDWSFSDGDSTGPLSATGSTPVTITAVNDAPTLTAFAAPVANGAENQSLEITFNTLLAQGNEADADGSVTAFVVNAVSTGTLTLGTSASSATAWNATTNSIIDATHQAYWTPASTANGDLNAFTVVARDNNGAASATSVQALVHIVPSQNTLTLTSSSPVDNAANVTASSNIVLTFSDVVQAGTGNIIITDGTDERIIAITDTTQVTLDGKTVTINPMADLQAGHHYHVTMASGVLQDMANNPYAGISDATTLDFTTNAPPTLTTFKAVVESTTQNTAIEISYADLAAQGDEADNDGTVAAFIVTSLSAGILKIGSDATTATTWDAVTNNTLDATHQAYWKPANNASGDFNAFTVVAKDNNGLESPLPVQTQVHVTAGPADLNPPVLLTATPADNTTGVAVASNIVLTFNEIVQAGTGNLIITDGTDERIIAITDTTQVTFNKNIVTINPTADLHAGHHYHVTIASDAIKDVTGNAYTGISDATTLDFTTIISPTHDLTENITFWKTGAAISDVATTITSVPTGDTHPIALKNIHVAADGSHVVEVWATTPNSTTGSMELEFALPTGSSATWQSAANLPVGWTSAANTIATSGHLLVGGMSANPLSEGQVKLGTLTITMPTNPDNLELLLVGGQLGDNDIEGFGISSISSNTGSGNEYLYHSLNDGNYNLTVDKLAGAREASAVHANDALAALKMSVAINPNSDGSGVLPYQFLAADINQDGRVRANDAFNILKMAVGLDTAPEDKWIFVSEDEALAATMSRTAVDWSVADINVLHNADTQLHLVGIVKGDVDGSWVA